MKNFYKILPVFFLFLLSISGFSQIGEDYSIGEGYTLKYYGAQPHESCGWYRIGYYANGYYEGVNVNISDFWEYKGCAGFHHNHHRYYLNDDEYINAANLFVTMDKNFVLDFLLRHKYNNTHTIVENVNYNIKVFPLKIDSWPNVCKTDNRINLNQYVKAIGSALYKNGGFPYGTFSGHGVTQEGSNYYFDPANANPSNTITFKYGSKEIIGTINVTTPTSISTSFPSSIYNTNSVGGVD